MPAAYKVRAMLAGLARLGEPSVVSGIECGHVAIERDVSLYAGIGDTADDNYMARYDIASLASAPEYVDWLLSLPGGSTPADYNPRVSQIVEHPDGRWKLDRLLEDNGIVRRFIVVAVP